MIRYAADLEEIRNKIKKQSPGWLVDATRKTAKFRKARRYSEKSSSWSKIKLVYMELQHAKCGYCERKLESGASGKIEWDVEHYRPKGEVKIWPDAKLSKKLAYSFPLGPGSKTGYYLLPYHPLNYLAACKVCNTPYKSNYFPIAGKRRMTSAAGPEEAGGELPFLPYPIAQIDEDPEQLLTFQGFICVPVANAGHRRNRAIVTIDFFRLNERDTLLEERAELIVMIWAMLQRQAADPSDSLADVFLKRVLSNANKHGNCARAFLKTVERDQQEAKLYVQKANEYLASKR
jgi:hypothetical protein